MTEPSAVDAVDTPDAVDAAVIDIVSVDIARPDDWHIHLRDDDMLDAVVGFSARWFRHALVMPNLKPPLVTTAAAQAYRDRIIAAAARSGDHPHFTPVMSLYLTAEISEADLREGWASGAVGAIKFYPAGATTNSEAGGSALLDFRPTLEVMAELGMPLLIHAESTDPALDIFDREAAFLAEQVAPLLAAMPELSVTVEHLSTAAGVDLVEASDNTFGTITPHHLSCDRSDLLANGMRPELYCKPVINSAENREALVRAATSGNAKFFLGTDSAPHPLSAKEARVVSAGIFNAPFALEVTAEVFHQRGAIDAYEAFVSLNGAARYGKEPSDERLTLVRSGAPSGEESGDDDVITTASGDQVRLFGVAESNLWSVSDSLS